MTRNQKRVLAAGFLIASLLGAVGAIAAAFGSGFPPWIGLTTLGGGILGLIVLSAIKTRPPAS